MKKMEFRLLCLLAILTPMTAVSQNNIKSAFDAIIKCPQAEISDTHSLIRDRETNLKSGQDDIYKFILPSEKICLVKNVLTAFDKDKDMSYTVKKGKNNGEKSKIELYSGDSGGISIDDPGCDYIYELFAPSKSEDPDGSHRYAYGFNYKEEDGKIIGKIVITYATMGEYRQNTKQVMQLKWLADMDELNRKTSYATLQQSWFEQVMACVNGLEDHKDSKKRIALATKAYKLVSDTKDYPDITSQDKTALRQIFRILKDRPTLQDPVLKELLTQCEAALN